MCYHGSVTDSPGSPDGAADRRKRGVCMKLAVLFPGIGYTCARPLLYYAGNIVFELLIGSYEVCLAVYLDDHSHLKIV